MALKVKVTYVNDQRYFITDNDHPSNFMISICGLSHKNEDKSYFKQIIDLAMTHRYKLRILGTMGLELALTLEGIFNLFYCNVTNLWDLCPGILLSKEAGASLLNEHGKPYKLGDENLFICKNEHAKAILFKNTI